MNEIQEKEKKLIEDVLKESANSPYYDFMRRGFKCSNSFNLGNYYAGRVSIKNLPEHIEENLGLERELIKDYISKYDVKKSKELIADYYLQAEAIHRARIKGHSLEKIAECLKVSSSTIREREKEFFSLDEVKKARREKYVEESERVHKLREECLTYKVIGERLGISESAARRRERLYQNIDEIKKPDNIENRSWYRDEIVEENAPHNCHSVASAEEIIKYAHLHEPSLKPPLVSDKDWGLFLDSTKRIDELMHHINTNYNSIPRRTLFILLVHGCDIVTKYNRKSKNMSPEERSHLIYDFDITEYPKLEAAKQKELAKEFIYRICGGRAELALFFLEKEKINLAINLTNDLLECWDTISTNRLYIPRDIIEEEDNINEINLFISGIPTISNQAVYFGENVFESINSDEGICMGDSLLYDICRSSLSKKSTEELVLDLRELPKRPRNIEELIEMNLPCVGEGEKFRQKDFYFWQNGMRKVSKHIFSDNLEVIRGVRGRLKKKYLRFKAYEERGLLENTNKFSQKLERAFITLDGLFRAREISIKQEKVKGKEFLDYLTEDLRTNYLDCVYDYWVRKEDIRKYTVFGFNVNELNEEEISNFNVNCTERAAVSPSKGIFFSDALQMLFDKGFVKGIFDLDDSEMNILRRQMLITKTVKDLSSKGSIIPELDLYRKFKKIFSLAG